MKITEEIWKQLAQLLKKRLLSQFDPSTMVPADSELRTKVNLPHKGFYLGVLDSSQKEVARVGFLKEDCTNILESAYSVIEAFATEMKAQAINHQVLPAASFHFTAIWDVVFIPKGLEWNENADGVYFAWGDRYKGLYLPYQIQRMTVTKTEIMNRLCSWEAKVPSNLWRLPEGLISRLICDSYTL
jgi:hypothetical protein